MPYVKYNLQDKPIFWECGNKCLTCKFICSHTNSESKAQEVFAVMIKHSQQQRNL